MEWLRNLLLEPSYTQTLLLLCLISATGIVLGKLQVKGVSLGVTFVFFMGIVAGDIMNSMGISFSPQMVLIMQNFGLIIFIYSLGMQVGPSFFPSLKQGGIKLNLLGLLTILLTTLTALLFHFLRIVDFPQTMGLLAGAVTNTPMLGAAQQSLLDADPAMTGEAATMARATAIGYPMGVFGVLTCLVIFKFTLGVKSNKKSENNDETYVAEFRITNPGICGKSIKDIIGPTGKNAIISRVWRNGRVTIPVSSTILQNGDHILVVLKKTDRDAFQALFGEQDKHDWNQSNIDWDKVDEGLLISKRILVTRAHANGTKIGDLHLRNLYNINITRITRAGVQLVASPKLRLQIGDRITVVGEKNAIQKVCEILGDEEKNLNSPNLFAIFAGIFVGVILGSMPIFIPGMSTPLKLGLAGGPIIIGILMGAFGSNLHIQTYTTRSANMMLKQLGITIYLACLGLNSGADFFETVFSLQGALWAGISLLIATVPVLISGFIAAKIFKLDYAQDCGMLCAAMANPMVLTYANSVSDEDEASEAYATVYPLSMFIRVLSAQIIMLIF